MNRRTIVLVLITTICFAQAAWAGPRDIIISMSGFLGTTEQAAPTLQKLFRQLEKTLGWPERSIDGAYYPETDAGLAAIKQRNPGFAVVSHQMYSDHGKSLKMKVIASMELSEGALSRYHVVTKKEGGPSALAQLSGRTIASPFIKEAPFVERVLFGGALSLSGRNGARPQYVKAPLRALRQVSRGRSDAALVDEPVVAQMSKLPFGNELRVIHSSPTIPPLPVVSLSYATEADRRPMAKALLSLCAGKQGAALCRSMRLKTVKTATAQTFADVQRKLSR